MQAGVRFVGRPQLMPHWLEHRPVKIRAFAVQLGDGPSWNPEGHVGSLRLDAARAPTKVRPWREGVKYQPRQ